jgi:hypothetical protein
MNNSVLTHKPLVSLGDGKFSCLCLCGILYELVNLVLNFISHATKNFCSLLGQSRGSIWVDDVPVSKMEREGKYRTPFLGRITDGDHVAETSFTDCAALFDFWSEMSMPASFMTSLAKGFKAPGFDPGTRDIK